MQTESLKIEGSRYSMRNPRPEHSIQSQSFTFGPLITNESHSGCFDGHRALFDDGTSCLMSVVYIGCKSFDDYWKREN